MNISVERIHYKYYTYNYDSTLNHLLTLLCHQVPIHTGLEESVCVIHLGLELVGGLLLSSCKNIPNNIGGQETHEADSEMLFYCK